jgi:hypothetical protein
LRRVDPDLSLPAKLPAAGPEKLESTAVKPVIIKKSYYTITFMRDDGAVRSLRLRGGLMRFFIFFFCVFLPAAGAAGVYVGLHYRYKTWTLSQEVRDTERQLADARIRLEQLGSVETIATTLGTPGGFATFPPVTLNNELGTRNATAGSKPVAQAPSSDILTLLQNGEADEAAARHNATKEEGRAGVASANATAAAPEHNATLTVAAGPTPQGNPTHPTGTIAGVAPSRNATVASGTRNATRVIAPYEDGHVQSDAAAPTTSTPKLTLVTDPQSPVRIANFQMQASAGNRLRLRFELVSPEQQRISGQIYYQLQLRNGTRQDLDAVEGARYFSISWKRQMEGAARLPDGIEVADIQAVGVRIVMENGSAFHAKYALNGE